MDCHSEVRRFRHRRPQGEDAAPTSAASSPRPPPWAPASAREYGGARKLVTGNFQPGRCDSRFGDGKKGSLEKHERGKWTYHDHLLIMKSHVQPLALSEFIGDRHISTKSPAKWSILAVGQLIWLRETNCPVSPTDYPLVKSGKWLYIYNVILIPHYLAGLEVRSHGLYPTRFEGSLPTS